MSNAARWKAFGAQGGGDYANVDPDKITIAEDDPKHPEHAAHIERTRLDKPIMTALMESMRQHGTTEVRPILVYLDGDALTVADGRRSTVACREINRERRAERKPILRLRAVRTKDPVLARNLSNSCREDDPPLVIARRFREACETMSPLAAAACLGLTLQYANCLLKVLSLPADVQAAVNRREVPPDVAVRAAKVGGGDAAREVIASATDASTGKVDAKKAKAAARQASGTRPKARPARVAQPFADELDRLLKNKARDMNGELAVPPHAVAVARWFAGDDKALDGFPDIRKALDSAKGITVS